MQNLESVAGDVRPLLEGSLEKLGTNSTSMWQIEYFSVKCSKLLFHKSRFDKAHKSIDLPAECSALTGIKKSKDGPTFVLSTPSEHGSKKC